MPLPPGSQTVPAFYIAAFICPEHPNAVPTLYCTAPFHFFNFHLTYIQSPCVQAGCSRSCTAACRATPTARPCSTPTWTSSTASTSPLCLLVRPRQGRQHRRSGALGAGRLHEKSAWFADSFGPARSPIHAANVHYVTGRTFSTWMRVSGLQAGEPGTGRIVIQRVPSDRKVGKGRGNACKAREIGCRQIAW